MTNCPGRTVRTSAPTSTTVPTNSWPRRCPGAVGWMPRNGHRSEPQMHAAVTSTMTSVGLTITGSSTSVTRTLRGLARVAARMVATLPRGATGCSPRRRVEGFCHRRWRTGSRRPLVPRECTIDRRGGRRDQWGADLEVALRLGHGPVDGPRSPARTPGRVSRISRRRPTAQRCAGRDARSDAAPSAGSGQGRCHATSTWTWSRCLLMGLSGSGPRNRYSRQPWTDLRALQIRSR